MIQFSWADLFDLNIHFWNRSRVRISVRSLFDVSLNLVLKKRKDVHETHLMTWSQIVFLNDQFLQIYHTYSRRAFEIPLHCAFIAVRIDLCT